MAVRGFVVHFFVLSVCFLEWTVALLRSPARGHLSVLDVVAVDAAPVSPHVQVCVW